MMPFDVKYEATGIILRGGFLVKNKTDQKLSLWPYLLPALPDSKYLSLRADLVDRPKSFLPAPRILSCD